MLQSELLLSQELVPLASPYPNFAVPVAGLWQPPANAVLGGEGAKGSKKASQKQVGEGQEVTIIRV